MSKDINRRDSVGAAGSALGLGIGLATAGCANGQPSPGKSPPPIKPTAGTTLDGSIRALVDRTPFIDTHEQLSPEANRVAALAKADATPVPDFGMLMSH